MARRRKQIMPPGTRSRFLGASTMRILFLILEAQRERRALTITDLSRATGHNKNAIYGHLKRLRAHGLVDWQPVLARTLQPTCQLVPPGKLRQETP